MGIFDKVLIVSDFDGTLTGSDGKIPEVNIDKIRYFIREGGRFSISTGRTKAGFHNFSAELINAPVLLGNGAMAYDFITGKNIFLNSISDDAIDFIENLYGKFPFLGTEIYSVDDSVCVINPQEKNLRHFSGLRIEKYKIVDLPDKSAFPVVKIMIYAGKLSQEVQHYLSTIDLGRLKYIPCNGEFIEILADTAGKGRALFQLARSLNIDENRVFAVGDGSNDVDMLSSQAVSFAPSSSDKLAKSAADHIVCDSDSGAIAEVIDRIEKLIRN